MGALNLAGSQFRGSPSELLLIVGGFATAVVVGVVLFLILNKRRETDRRAGILPVYGEPMSLPELMVVAHSRGYTVQKNDRVYAFMRHQGRP
ncbi:hypothetical protein [Amycolatopsis sp.]|uniref:hypothetical protein n=1 Tax=Amycolatopsis sp. TaxID=37632 RepID=UPI002D7F5B3D|nr:hypothetical protein [Amycolatopsis sp.]HET6703778.1 hypothetical protein [Amycolatopsis sp.]